MSTGEDNTHGQQYGQHQKGGQQQQQQQHQPQYVPAPYGKWPPTAKALPPPLYYQPPQSQAVTAKVPLPPPAAKSKVPLPPPSAKSKVAPPKAKGNGEKAQAKALAPKGAAQPAATVNPHLRIINKAHTKPATVQPKAAAGLGKVVLASQQYMIQVDRTPQAPKLGIEADFSDPLHLRIQNVGPGVLEQWNADQPEAVRVKAGDMVVRVNGKEGNSKQLAEELKSAEQVDMLVEKSSGQPGVPNAKSRVVLVRTPQASALGLEVSFEPQSLEIECIDKDGLIAQWNYQVAKHGKKMIVFSGDRIIGVNEKKNASATSLAEELRQERVLRILIHRGPNNQNG